MAYKNYKIRDNWLDIDKYNDVDIQSVNGVIQTVKVNGEDVGGGDSSDFSTAQMTIAGNQSSIGLTCAYLYEESGEAALTVSSGGIFLGEYTVPLYKGVATAQLDYEEIGNVVVSGNATINEDGLIIITGDCTITIS